MDSLLFSLKLNIADYDPESYIGINQELIWTIGIVATFMVQITLLNMLIAIMGDTFDRVMDTKLESGLNEKVSMLSDFVPVIRMFNIRLNGQYLLVVRPSDI